MPMAPVTKADPARKPVRALSANTTAVGGALGNSGTESSETAAPECKRAVLLPGEFSLAGAAPEAFLCSSRGRDGANRPAVTKR
jgi:hypothetical protein